MQWFKSYLTNRQHYVSLDGIESSIQTVICGIPQGSALGPLLFLINIHDIPNSSYILSLRIFAGDTNIFAPSYKARDLKILVIQELLKVKEWCDLNKLSINFKKTNYMIIRSAQKKIQHTFNIKFTNKDGPSFS